jgi:regulator of replication initiation timing
MIDSMTEQISDLKISFNELLESNRKLSIELDAFFNGMKSILEGLSNALAPSGEWHCH